MGKVSIDRICQSFETVFNIPKSVISTEFKKYLEKILKEEYPRLRCSSARTVLEGKVPGVPLPVPTVHQQWKRHIRHGMLLMDIFETIVQCYLQEWAAPKLDNAPVGIPKEQLRCDKPLSKRKAAV